MPFFISGIKRYVLQINTISHLPIKDWYFDTLKLLFSYKKSDKYAKNL